MRTNWTFQSCDNAVRSRLKEVWAKEWPRVETRLAPYPLDLPEVLIILECHPLSTEQTSYKIHVEIQLPTGVVAADADDNNLHTAVREVIDALSVEIERHKEDVRKEYESKHKPRQRQELSAAGPQLERDVDRQEEFSRRLRPLLGFLRDHARRELRVLEIEGNLHRHEATVDDVLDEVLIRAWKRFDKRPPELPLNLWLVRLLHEVLEEWQRQEPRPHESTEVEMKEDVPPDTKFQIGEQDWWNFLLDNLETFRLEDFVPDADEPVIWNELEEQERRDRLFALLSELPTRQRQTLMLFALEDYDPADIARIQNRSEAEVQADIESAREALRRRLRELYREQATADTASHTVASSNRGSNP